MTTSLRSLADWLARLEGLHPSAIALGLSRVARVRDALGLRPACPVIIVGGTNGKGSTAAYLEAVYRAAGYRTGLYTSPHLLRYNERVRIDGRDSPDAAIIAAFERVDAARGTETLTYFEFGTLGAVLQLVEADVDVMILEVGLGGRLDAVNIFDADVAVVTSVDLDHMDYLGDTREAIGFEKAGIFRAGRPAICSDASPPASLRCHANDIGARLQCVGEQFDFSREADGWTYRGPARTRESLPLPSLAGAYQLSNAAGALAAVDALAARLPVTSAALRQGLVDAHVAGRFQRIAAKPQVVVDVAHNPHAARALASTLRDTPVSGRTWAVVGMLADKDVVGVCTALVGLIDGWWVATPDSPRALAAPALAEMIRPLAGTASVQLAADVVDALKQARLAAHEDDRILVFGSFYTVAAVLDHAATQQ